MPPCKVYNATFLIMIWASSANPKQSCGGSKLENCPIVLQSRTTGPLASNKNSILLMFFCFVFSGRLAMLSARWREGRELTCTVWTSVSCIRISVLWTNVNVTSNSTIKTITRTSSCDRSSRIEKTNYNIYGHYCIVCGFLNEYFI